jgi:hypothetical protein
LYEPIDLAAVNDCTSQRRHLTSSSRAAETSSDNNPHFQQIVSAPLKIRVAFQHFSHVTPNLRCSTLRQQIAQLCG